MRRETINRVALALTGLCALAIAFGTLTPPEAMPKPPPGGDKLHHYLAFAALVFPAVLVRPRSARWMVPLAVAYGGVIEIIQPAFGRGAEWGDFVADTLGAVSGAGLGWLLNRLWLRPWLLRRAAARAQR